MNTQNYYSRVIDAHKSFCQVHILHPNGSDAYKGRINQNERGEWGREWGRS